jgi:ribose transport system substrate-binding protein
MTYVTKEQPMSSRSLSLGVVGLAVLGLTTSACSSGSSSTKASSDSSSGTCTGLADAKAFLAQAKQNPTGVGYDLPVTGAIPKNQKIVALETPVPVAKATNDLRDAADKMLGWTTSRIVVEGTPEGPAKAMGLALDRKPSAIFYSGYDPASMAAPLSRAAGAKVPVIGESVPNNTNAAIGGTVRDDVSNDRIAKMTAAYLVSDSGCKANVEAWTVPSQPILTTYQDSLKKWMTQWCSSCKMHLNNYEFSDIGTNVPGMVVSALQKNPKAGYVIFGYGESVIGVDAALATASLSDKVKIGGAIPGPDQYEGLRKGTDAFWATDSGPASAWKETDMTVRALAGDSLAEVQAAPIVAQLLTSDNVKQAAFDKSGYWVGFNGYEDAYKKMWKLA